MKYVFVFICFISFFDVESQEFSGMFSAKINEKDASYSAVDNSTSDVTVFFVNRSKAKVILLDSKTTFQDSLSAKSITEYKKLVRQNIYDKTAKLVFANNDFSSFLIQNFDFKTIYKLDANYYLGYYNKANKNYSIRKFQD
jgi:hypothetical protein